jgi:hypothetical protein
VDTLDVDTAAGPGRLTLSLPDAPDAPDAPRAVLLLGHGAGGGIDTLDLAALAEGLPPHGIAVARYEQPWRLAGRKVATPPATLDLGWRPALDAVGARLPGVPLVVGGRSAGARVACRCFATPAVGVLALSFPLHPPGRPEKSRATELAGVDAPVLVVSGDRDPFGSPDELRAAIASGQAGPRTLVVVEGSAHSFRALTRRRADAGERPTQEQIVDAAASFVLGLVG